MTLPAYESLPDYKPVSRQAFWVSSYEGHVEQYGPPPQGYRWLKVGELVPEGTIFASGHDQAWFRVPMDGNHRYVIDGHYAQAAPIVAPDTNNTSATLTVRQCAEMFNEWARVAEGLERPAAYAECAQLLKNSCRDYV